MSLIDKSVQGENIKIGVAQLKATEPAFNYKKDSLLGKAGNFGPISGYVLGFLTGIFDIATVGIFEIINRVYYACTTNSYEQLCKQFAEKQIALADKKPKDVTRADRMAVQNLRSELNGRVSIASKADGADEQAIKEAVQYKIERAICKQLEPKTIGNNYTEETVQIATDASKKFGEIAEEDTLKSEVSGLISSKGFYSLDEEAIKETANDTGKSVEEVRAEIGSQLAKRHPTNEAFREASKAPDGDVIAKQVTKNVNDAVSKLKDLAAKRSKASSEIHRIENELTTRKEKRDTILETLGVKHKNAGEGAEEQEATLLYADRAEAEEKKKSARSDVNKAKAQTALNKINEKIKKHEAELRKLDEETRKYNEDVQTQTATLAEVEEEYVKLVEEHFDIQDGRERGTYVGAKMIKDRDGKIAKAIVLAGTINNEEDMEGGKCTTHKLPENLKNYFNVPGLKNAMKEKRPAAVELATELRDAGIARRKEEAKRKKEAVEVAAERAAEIALMTKGISDGNTAGNRELIAAFAQFVQDLMRQQRGDAPRDDGRRDDVRRPERPINLDDNVENVEQPQRQPEQQQPVDDADDEGEEDVGLMDRLQNAQGALNDNQVDNNNQVNNNNNQPNQQ